MDALLESVPFDTLGIGGLISFAVLSIWRGWWVAGPIVKILLEGRDLRITELVEERNELRITVRLKDETLREQSAQVDELLELAKTGNALMRALASAAGKDPV